MTEKARKIFLDVKIYDPSLDRGDPPESALELAAS